MSEVSEAKRNVRAGLSTERNGAKCSEVDSPARAFRGAERTEINPPEVPPYRAAEGQNSR